MTSVHGIASEHPTCWGSKEKPNINISTSAEAASSVFPWSLQKLRLNRSWHCRWRGLWRGPRKPGDLPISCWGARSWHRTLCAMQTWKQPPPWHTWPFRFPSNGNFVVLRRWIRIYHIDLAMRNKHCILTLHSFWKHTDVSFQGWIKSYCVCKL